VLLPALVALAFTTDATRLAGMALIAFCTYVLFQYRGGELARGSLSGLCFSALPFATTLIARQSGHYCAMGACRSFCLPMCLCAGAIAGALLIRASRAATSRPKFLTAGATMTAAVGALSCMCVGYSSLLGAALGLCLTAGPVALQSLRKRRA
jgi:hypothetical protein